MYHHKQMDTTIVVLAETILDRLIRLFRPDVVERFDIALFKQHGLQVLQSFEDLFARLISKAALFELFKKRSSSRAACQSCMAAKLHNSKRIKHRR